MRQQFLVKDWLNRKSRVLLLTNYMLDRQQSMIRFGKLLLSPAIEERIDIEEIKPIPFFGRFNVFQRTSKWAAYIDKYLLFHKTLQRRLFPCLWKLSSRLLALMNRLMKNALKNQFRHLRTWILDSKPLEPVPGRKLHIESAFEVKHSQIQSPEGTN